MKLITKSPEETEKLGEDFARKLRPKDVVFLVGNLGSGKTTFTKGVAKGLGITTRIISPTYVVLRSHSVKNGPIRTLYHFDLYRLKDEKETLGVDFTDYLEDENGIVIIEWPQVSQYIIKRKTWKVIFQIREDMREIEILQE